MLRETSFAPNENYHIYGRGVEKRKIFLDKNDYCRFLILLYLSNNVENLRISNFFRGKTETERKKSGSEKNYNWSQTIDELFSLQRKNQLVSVIGYCLMPNHFHLLIQERIKGGISQFMKKLLTAYSMYFNKKYERSGPLFVRPFRSKHIDDENYFKYLFAYIHLNPVKLIQVDWKEVGIKNKKEVVTYLTNYHYSSYIDFLGKDRIEKNILDRQAIPNFFSSLSDFDGFVTMWLKHYQHIQWSKESPWMAC